MNTKYYKEDGLIYKDNTKEILIGYDSKYDFSEEIILPDTIKVIEDRALSNLNEDKETITKLTIPSSVEKMGKCILANTSVFQLIIEEGIKKIDYNAFAYSNVMLCDLPESLEEIDKCAFSNSNLQTINLKNIKRIGSYAFSETNIDAVKMLNVEFIDDYAFCNCACLENVEIKAKKLIPIPKFCFSECSKLKSVKLDNILSINPSAFVSTYELKTLNIPKECVSIDDSAFACSGLTSIFIPNNVHMIKYLAFYGCKDLKDFKIEEGIPELPGLIIEEFAFKDCGIEELTLPSSVQILKNEACAQMPKLVKLTVNANVKSLPASFAYKCKRLSEIILSPEIKELQSYCFASTNINSVNENFKNVAVFGDSCFADCKNLEEIYIRKNTFLHHDVFSGCEHLILAVILSFMSNNVFTRCYNFDLIAPSMEDYIREEIERNPDINLVTDFSDELIAKLTDFLPFKDVSKLVDGR